MIRVRFDTSLYGDFRGVYLALLENGAAGIAELRGYAAKAFGSSTGFVHMLGSEGGGRAWEREAPCTRGAAGFPGGHGCFEAMSVDGRDRSHPLIARQARSLTRLTRLRGFALF
jgi:hypothetical protein